MLARVVAEERPEGRQPARQTRAQYRHRVWRAPSRQHRRFRIWGELGGDLITALQLGDRAFQPADTTDARSARGFVLQHYR